MDMPRNPLVSRCALLALGCIATVGSPGRSAAQGYPFSQRGSVTQSVAFTTIAVAYGRPVARGRVLFGQLVPWDSIWHPGADSATRVSFDHDVVLEGRTLKAAEYSLWLLPREHKPWTVISVERRMAFTSRIPGRDTT